MFNQTHTLLRKTTLLLVSVSLILPVQATITVESFSTLSSIDTNNTTALVNTSLSQVSLPWVSEQVGIGAEFSDGEQLSSIGSRFKATFLIDLNNDGHLDALLGTGSTFTSADSVFLLGNGDGTFGTPVILGSNSYNVLDLVTLDINNDGYLDVVAAKQLANDQIYLNNGDGTFADGAELPDSDLSSTIIVSADIDNDGDLDLLTGASSRSSLIYLNNGDGTFLTGTSMTSSFSSAGSLVTVDINNDGYIDVLEGNIFNGNNKLYLNNADGTFSEGVDIDTDGDTTRGLLAIDVDNDGDLDVVAGNDEVPNKLYLNNGDATFASAIDLQLATELTETRGLVAEDLDKDGDIDIVETNYDEGTATGAINKYYLNNGDGTFSSGFDLGTAVNRGDSIAIGDIDNDGDPDVLTGNSDSIHTIFLNNTNHDTSVSTLAVGSMVGTALDNTKNVSHADIDNDGDLDLFVANNGQTNKIYLNNGDNTFTNSVDISSDIDKTMSLTLIDIDKDGDIDVLAGNDGQVDKLYLNNTDKNAEEISISFSAGLAISSDENATRSLVVLDLNRDGNLDIISGNANQVNQIHMNNGNTTFATAVNLSADIQNTKMLTIADMDNDSYPDILAANDGQSNTLYLNNADATFLAGTNIDTVAYSTSGITTVDLNHDGALDILTANNGAENKIYLGNGDGTFLTGLNIHADIEKTVSIAAADVDHDGDIDVVAGNEGQQNTVYINDGSNNFTAKKNIGSETVTTTSLLIADMDSDGDVDLFVGNDGAENALYLQGSYEAEAQITSLMINNNASDGIKGISLNVDQDLDTTSTSVDYFVSRDGGSIWHSVNVAEAEAFVFPDTDGNDIRWRATLKTNNTITSPIINNVELTTSSLSITAAVYDYVTGELIVTGEFWENKDSSDIDASLITLTGYNNETYTLTDTPDVEVDNVSQFTLMLSTTDKQAVSLLFNKDGSNAADDVLYNISAADDFITAITASDISDTIANGITISNAPINNAPVISGPPTGTVIANNTYSFTPTATDEDTTDSLTFSITGKPSWADFDTATGTLSGTASSDDIGVSESIVITVTDDSILGIKSANLAAFTIEVLSADETNGSGETDSSEDANSSKNKSSGGSTAPWMIISGLFLIAIRRKIQTN